MKTYIHYTPCSWANHSAPRDTLDLLKKGGADRTFCLPIGRIILPEGTVFSYRSKKYKHFLDLKVVEVRYDPFKDILTYDVDFDDTELSDEELLDELLTVWIGPIS